MALLTEVEVLCDAEYCGWCHCPDPTGTPTTHRVVGGSVTEARLNLADAAEAWHLAALRCGEAADRGVDGAEFDEIEALRDDAHFVLDRMLAALRTARGA